MTDEVNEIHNYSVDASDVVQERTEFDDYDSFMALIERRQQRFGEKWVKDKSVRLVETSNMKIRDARRHFKSKFKYAFIKLMCERSGNTRSKAVVKKSSTKKLNCPVFIKVSANRTKDKMIVTGCHLEHNHEPNLPSTVRYPRKPEEKEEYQVEGTEVTDSIKIFSPKASFIRLETDASTEDKSFVKTYHFNPMKKYRFQPIRPKVSGPEVKILNINSPQNSQNVITLFNGTKVSTVRDEINPGTNSSSSILNSNQPRSLLCLPSQVKSANIDSNQNSHTGEFTQLGSEKAVAVEESLSRESIINLIESKFVEAQKNDAIRQSKNFNYGLTVVERLDLLDQKSAFSARKDIDEILLKYILGCAD